MNGDEGALLAPERQGHRGDPEGGKPPPPTVPPVWNDVAMKGPEWDSPTQITVQPGRGAEAAVINGGGGG